DGGGVSGGYARCARPGGCGGKGVAAGGKGGAAGGKGALRVFVGTLQSGVCSSPRATSPSLTRRHQTTPT
ncbi:hypothetical protein KUCAC02_005559, partial [Chaenocephalus aceratus]